MKMDDDYNALITSGGRNFPLYAELGRYFSTDGKLDEQSFRAIIRESLERIKSDSSREDFHEKAQGWLTSYLEEVLAYLSDKGMSQASFRIFQAALEEALKCDIKNLNLSTSSLREMLSGVPVKSEQPCSRKHAPEEKKKKIFDAALQVFSKRGFHEATLDEITSMAGVGKGTVYRNFRSKEELLDQLLIHKSQLIVDKFTEIFSRPGDLLEQIQKTIEVYICFIEKNHVLYRLIQNEAIVKRSGSRAMFYDYLISNLPMIKERIVSLNREGQLKTTNFYTVWYGVLGFIDGVVHKWFRTNMSYPLSDEIPVILEVLFNGFVEDGAYGKKFFVPPEKKEKNTK